MSTPSSNWQKEGKEDPHGKAYLRRREDLPLGKMTDDELANAVFLHNHREINIDAVLRGEPSSIGLLTAAQKRIRWLSRQLASLSPKALYWSDCPGGVFPDDEFVSFEIEGIEETPDGINVIDVKDAKEFSVYARRPDREAVCLHTTSSLEEAHTRLHILEAPRA